MKVVVALVLTVTFTTLGCSSSGKEATPPPAEMPRPATAPGRTLVIGEGPAGAIVELTPLFEHDFGPPSGQAFMDQSGQMFIPGLLTAKMGQEVAFISSEDILHNIRVDHGESTS